MTADAKSARDDLAFLKALVGEDENSGARSWAEAYLAGGLIYGGQMLLHAAQALGWIAQAPLLGLVIGIGPTVLFVPTLIWINRRNPPPISPKARLSPVTMMVTTATTLATGPSIDSRMRCNGASHGMPEPAACAALIAITSMARPSQITTAVRTKIGITGVRHTVSGSCDQTV